MERKHKIWNYLRDEGRGKAANGLEREALEDPFLYEALEGLESVGGEHRRVVELLERRVRQRVMGRRRSVVAMWWGVAAVVVMGVGALWLLRGSEGEKEQMAAGVNGAGTVQVEVAAVESGEKQTMKVEMAADERVEGETGTGKKRKVLVSDAYEAAEDVKEVLTEGMGRSAAPMAKRTGRGRVVQGVVVDAAGNPLPGVTILAGSMGVVTDIQGRFKLGVADTVQTLMASFVGMKTVTFAATSGKNVRVTMTEDSMQLNEVVVSGYHEVRKQTFTAATTIATATAGWEDYFYRYVADSLRYPAEAIRGRVEGEVVLSLHFNRRGRPGRIKILQKLTPACDREAIRLVETYPGLWGLRREDVTVRIRFKLP